MKPGHDSFSPGPGLAGGLSEEERRCLEAAHRRLEYPSFAAHLASVIGTPIEKGLKLMPPRWYRQVRRPVEAVVGGLLGYAVRQIGKPGTRPRAERFYRYVGVGAGALGGLLGGASLVLELPFTTLVMLAAIAEIARDEGEDPNRVETRLACLEVFALGGRSKADDAADTGYYGLRLALEAAVAQASRHIAEHGFSRSGGPAISRLILAVSERFGLVVSEKAAAELMPLVGALGGAIINDLFIRHFQDMARSHFALRRLERKHGRAFIEAEYRKLGAMAR
jgi:hypothetical protein